MIAEERQFSPFPAHTPGNYTTFVDSSWDFGRICLAVSLGILSLVTVLGNALILLAIATSRSLRAMPFSIFLANMAFTDLLVGAVLDSMWGIYSVYGALPLEGGTACYIYLGIEYLISFATPSGLLAIASDRAWEARWPAHHMRHSSRYGAAMLVLASWAYPLMIWGPTFIWDRLRHPYQVGDCYFDHENHVILTYLLATLGYLLPVLAALVCYTVMAYAMFVRRFQWKAEDEMCVQRERLMSLASTTKGFVVPQLSLFVQQPYNKQYQPPDNTSEASKISSASEINDLVFFKDFTNEELGAARLEHHLERCSFYLLSAKLAVYLISWTPYFVTFFCAAGGPLQLPAKYVMFSVWNTYISAAVNPILTILSGEHVGVHIQNMMYTTKDFITSKIGRRRVASECGEQTENGQCDVEAPEVSGT